MSLRLSIISASMANIAILIQMNAKRMVLSVKSWRTKMSNKTLVLNRVAKNRKSGINNRIGAKYIPVLAINCTNLRVSLIGLIWLLPIRLE